MAELTPRQQEVARLVAAGCSNKVIAQIMHISRHTVTRHTQEIYERLGIHTRVALALYVVGSPERKS